ncbi:MAG: diphthine synthase [Candidatus Aenigmarchaeota archaeon]|nr:diphthine synthase [Candidatus Aenigmarchaeota archaeon]
MLYLIGAGLKKGDITLNAVEALENCQKIYAEHYTGHMDVDYISDFIHREIIVLDRAKVESLLLIEEAKENNIALLTPGDPLTATTHIELMIEAIRQGVEIEIIHSPSIFTAVAECGLQLYKFGRTATLARPQQNYNPDSPYDIIVENKKSGLHTLMLMEIDMPAKEAVEILKKIETKKNGNVLKEKIIAVHFGEQNKIQYRNADSLDLQTPCCLVIPGNLHFKEEEALELWK